MIDYYIIDFIDNLNNIFWFTTSVWACLAVINLSWDLIDRIKGK